MNQEQAIKTEWYTGDQKPVHIGVYERKIKGEGLRYSMWSGAVWLNWCFAVSQAYKQRGQSRTQNAPWRGLNIKGRK